MVIPLSFFSFAFYICIFLILLSTNVYSFEGRKIQQQNYYHSIQISNLLSSPHCKHSSKVGRSDTLLKVVHKHGPCSESNQENGKTPNLTKILLQDQSRVDSIHSKQTSLQQSDASKLPTRSGASLGTGNYVVNVGIGSPKKDLALIFDTGSDLTWARCNSAQTLDPTKSTSYRNVSCSSAVCASSATAAGRSVPCSDATCSYRIQYGDGSFTQGFLGTERLTIGSNTFDNFYFGCGQENEGLFGRAEGLLGLGRDDLSVVSQTASTFDRIFSYCIPASPSSTGFLSFGSSQSNSAKFTPLASSSRDNFYNLNMIGISVKGKRLPISPSVFSTSGTIIDSGTVITRLPPQAYSALRSAFSQEMANYPKGEPLSILDTCYDFSNYKTVNVPKILISFSEGVNLDIDQFGIFVANGLKQVCLAFAGNSDPSEVAIFGNTQQKNYEVVYNVGAGKVGFAPSTCS